MNFDERFITDQIGYASVLGQFVCVAHGHPMLYGGASGMNRLHQRQERHVEKKNLVFSVIGNPNHLVRMQPRI